MGRILTKVEFKQSLESLVRLGINAGIYSEQHNKTQQKVMEGAIKRKEKELLEYYDDIKLELEASKKRARFITLEKQT